jgi:hypothetical protein
LPFLLGGTLYGIFKTWESLALNTRTVHEVRLKRDGGFVEIGFLTYSGKVKAKNWFTMPIGDLASPPLFEDSTPLRGDLFPSDK